MNIRGYWLADCAFCCSLLRKRSDNLVPMPEEVGHPKEKWKGYKKNSHKLSNHNSEKEANNSMRPEKSYVNVITIY